MRFLLLLACLTLPMSSAWADDVPPVPAPEGQAEVVDRAATIARFQEFIAANPERPEIAAARFRLASLLMGQAEGHPSAAERAAAAEQFERALADEAAGRAEGFAQVAEAWFLLGFCRQQDDPAAAVRAWEQVLAVAPDTSLAASAGLSLGQLALDAGDWAVAAARFEAARGGDRDAPTWAQATYLGAWSRYRAQDYPAAIGLLVELLGQEGPAAAALHREALATLAFTLVDAAGEAGSVPEGVAEVAPSLPEARRVELIEQVVALLEQLGRFDEAGDVRGLAKKKRRRGR